MFKNLLSFWKGKDFLSEVFGEFKDMLDESQVMFETVCGRLLENTNGPELKQKVYDIDQKVNLLQKSIRRRIVEHLSLQPTVDVTACLVLMSVVKDAERLGDYCKNLYEVSEFLEKPIDRALFDQYFDNIHDETLSLFGLTKDAFLQGDEEKGRAACRRELIKRCDKIVEELTGSDLTVNEAVCYALIARYIKRIIAHLVNIATSVLLPLSDLDYCDEERCSEE
jgi:phosphate uptake regulator